MSLLGCCGDSKVTRNPNPEAPIIGAILLVRLIAVARGVPRAARRRRELQADKPRGRRSQSWCGTVAIVYEPVLTVDGRSFGFTEPYLAGIYYGEPSPKARLLFSEYLEPHPEGFSAMFEARSSGWFEERVDPCGVHVFKLSSTDGAHLFLVQWLVKGDELHEVTRRQMRQMSDTWDRMFPNQEPIARAPLLKLIAGGAIVSPSEMGLAEENAGLASPYERKVREPSKKRRWLFGG